MDENNQVIVSEPQEIIAEEIKTNDKPRKTWIGKLILVLIILGLLIFGILYTNKEYKVYKNAKKYENAFNLVQKQLNRCTSIKLQDGEDASKIVHYCDELNSQFRSVPKEEVK